MSLLDDALALAETGIPVFPCSADKNPVCVGGFKAATTDPARIRALFRHTAAALIGMPTGPRSGRVVIDIDPRHGGDAWLTEHGTGLVTRRHGTMSGGVHLVFCDSGEGIRNSAGRIAIGVDVRGDGGYVIVPPSPGYSVQVAAELATLPDWLAVECLRQPQQQGEAGIPTAPRAARQAPGEAMPYGRAALESACEEIRNARDGQKHEIINRVAYSIGGLVPDGEITEGEARAALNDALEALRPACKDFRAAQRVLDRSFREGMSKPRAVPELVQVEPDLSNIAPFMAKLAAQQDMVRRAASAKPLPVKSALMDVDGALQLFVDYCDATAISPQPFLALAAGITAIGALAGRKYRTKTNLRTNVYAVGVADSGGGKDHARKAIKTVFAAAGLTSYMGGEDIASGTAMMTALGRHPCMLFQIDEFGDWLGEVLGPKAASHKKQIAQRLKTLYSAAGSFVSGTEYADQSKLGKPREDIQQPHACLYGTTTPGQFWRAIADASMEDGLLARFLVCVSPESYPDEKDPQYIDPPGALVAAFKAIAEGAGGGNLASVMVAGTAPEPYLVEMTDEAEAAYKAMRQHQLERQRRNAGTYITAITARLAENATKLALVRAVSRDPVAPRITAADMAWSRAMAEHCIDTLLREADENIAETPFARNMAQVLKLIRKHGPVSEYELVRRGWKIPDRERAEILRTLCGTGQIVAFETGGGRSAGRATIKYQMGPEQ